MRLVDSDNFILNTGYLIRFKISIDRFNVSIWFFIKDFKAGGKLKTGNCLKELFCSQNRIFIRLDDLKSLDGDMRKVNSLGYLLDTLNGDKTVTEGGDKTETMMAIQRILLKINSLCEDQMTS